MAYTSLSKCVEHFTESCTLCHTCSCVFTVLAFQCTVHTDSTAGLSCSHVNRVTQYENPVAEAKRRFAGSQLPQTSGLGPPSYSYRPPPIKEPPNIQSTAAIEKQREAEAAMMWPDAGLRDFQDGGYPYPYQQPSEQDLEAQLQGDPISVKLTKTAQGFGFTIIGGDRPGELLQVKSIVRGSVAEHDGSLLVGDVLVRINGICVLGYSHRKVVELFQSLPLNCEVDIEIRRGYPLPDYRNDDLPPYPDPSRDYQNTVPLLMGTSHQTPSQQPEIVVINIVKGPLGFGFSLGEPYQLFLATVFGMPTHKW